jgi:hypothetical protein
MLIDVLTAVDVLVKNAVDTELVTAVAVALCMLTLVEVVVPEVLTVEAITFVEVAVVDAVVVAWLGPLPPLYTGGFNGSRWKTPARGAPVVEPCGVAPTAQPS